MDVDRDRDPVGDWMIVGMAREHPSLRGQDEAAELLRLRGIVRAPQAAEHIRAVIVSPQDAGLVEIEDLFEGPATEASAP